MRRASNILLLLTCLAMVHASCKRNEPQPDYASIIEGTYTGTVTTGSSNVSGTTSLVRYTNSKVDMHIAAGTHTLNIYGIMITTSGNDLYYLSYSIAGNTLVGTVQGNLLTYTLASGTLNGTFTGSR
ncbi:MAG: hypothetical protein IH592_05220 [Bacteroidales bacterium]|nr:hypothetical protein [Bacteroidales bacterium]